jgi:hypothetical protein
MAGQPTGVAIRATSVTPALKMVCCARVAHPRIEGDLHVLPRTEPINHAIWDAHEDKFRRQAIDPPPKTPAIEAK